MREIKLRGYDKVRFRAYDKIDGFGEMITLNTLEGTATCITNDGITFLANIEELQQYTGLKDKNGKEIYEGDILKLEENFAKITDADRNIVIVGYDMGGFMYGRSHDPLHMNTYLWMGAELKSLEIIGNIYENPELLKKDE